MIAVCCDNLTRTLAEEKVHSLTRWFRLPGHIYHVFSEKVGLGYLYLAMFLLHVPHTRDLPHEVTSRLGDEVRQK